MGAGVARGGGTYYIHVLPICDHGLSRRSMMSVTKSYDQDIVFKLIPQLQLESSKAVYRA